MEKLYVENYDNFKNISRRAKKKMISQGEDGLGEKMGFKEKMDLHKEDWAMEKMCFRRRTMPKEMVLRRRRGWGKDRARERT